MSDSETRDKPTEPSKLTKEQANAIAESLMAKARNSDGYFRSRRVPFVFRSADSARLEPRAEWQLFRQAQHNLAGNRWSAVTIMASYVTLLLVFLMFAPHPLNDWYTPLFFIGLMGPPFISVVHVRRELARLARESTPQP
jgi:hypothetical protein